MTKCPKTAVSFYFLFSLELHLFVYYTVGKRKKHPHLIRPSMGFICKMFLGVCSTGLENTVAVKAHSLPRAQSSQVNHREHVQKSIHQ